MDNSVLAVFAIIGIALAAGIAPLIGLVAVAWAAFKWLGIYAAIVIVLCWGRYGPPVWGVYWPAWPAPPAK